MVVVCLIFVPVWFGFVPRSEYYIARSEAHCARYANEKKKAISFNVSRYDPDKDKYSLELKCGVGLVDCPRIED